MEKTFKKADEILDQLKNTEEFKKIIELKEIIKSDVHIRNLILEFEDSKTQNFNLETSKVKLYNNPTIKEYLNIQNKLDYLIMHLNAKISELIKTNDCNNPKDI